MVEIPIKEQIKKLTDLQRIDSEVYQYKVELKEKPARLEELRVAFESKKSGLKALEEKSKALLVDRKAKELELQSKEQDQVKANSQLSQINTNKEYTAKLSEIEHIKADKSLIEEKILILYEDVDAVNAQIQNEKNILGEEEKKYLAEKKKVEDLVKELQDRVSSLQAQRAQSMAGIEKANLAKYERILEHKEGLAIVPVVSSSCGGCFMNVPPQVINEIQMADKLIFCEMCTRILYLQPDVK